MTVLARLAELLRRQGGLVGSATVDPDARACPGPGGVAAAGPLARGRASEYELLMEAIYEGYLLHYGGARVVRTGDRDLGLLAGDQLYALGLMRLVALGDVAAVAELADVITLTALAQASGDCELADAVWAAGARAVGWGSADTHSHAKALARAGHAEAAPALRAFAGGSPSFG